MPALPDIEPRTLLGIATGAIGFLGGAFAWVRSQASFRAEVRARLDGMERELAEIKGFLFEHLNQRR